MPRHLRPRVEEGRRAHHDAHGGPDPEPRPEVLQEDRGRRRGRPQGREARGRTAAADGAPQIPAETLAGALGALDDMLRALRSKRARYEDETPSEAGSDARPTRRRSRSGRARRARASSFRRRSGRGRTATTARRACGAASRATTSARSRPWSSSARPRAARSSDVMSRFRGGAIGAAAHVTSCALRQRAGKSAAPPPMYTPLSCIVHHPLSVMTISPKSACIPVAATAWALLGDLRGCFAAPRLQAPLRHGGVRRPLASPAPALARRRPGVSPPGPPGEDRGGGRAGRRSQMRPGGYRRGSRRGSDALPGAAPRAGASLRRVHAPG